MKFFLFASWIFKKSISLNLIDMQSVERQINRIIFLFLKDAIFYSSFAG